MRPELKSWIEQAKDLSRPPDIQSDEPVELQGEALLEPIVWQGRQWAVTPYGIEARDGTYPISSDRLWEQEDEWGWVRHMEEKTWVDMPDFVEALRVARRHWRSDFETL